MPQLKTAALVLGLDSHGLAITRALTDSGVAVYALEKDMSLPGVAASRVVKIFQTPDFSESNLMQALHDIRRQLRDHAKVVLFTVNDRQVEIIGQRIDELQPMYEIAWADGAHEFDTKAPKSLIFRVSPQWNQQLSACPEKYL